MSKYTVGVDVGGTNVKLGLVSPSGKVISRSRLVTKAFNRNKIVLIKAIVSSINHLIKSNGLSKSDIAGIGLGLPGLINPKKGIVAELPNILGWNNVPLVKLIKKQLKLPVYIDNDVNIITLAEWKYGAGEGM